MKKKEKELKSTEEDEQEEHKKKMSDSVKEGLRSSKEIFMNRDFLAVVFGNFFHIMRTVGAANFLAIFVEALISPNYNLLAVGTTVLSLYYTACNAVPKVLLRVSRRTPRGYGS